MLAFSKFQAFRDNKLWLSEDLTRWEQQQRTAIMNSMEMYWQVENIPFRHFSRSLLKCTLVQDPDKVVLLGLPEVLHHAQNGEIGPMLKSKNEQSGRS